jgi:hypothetical protein
MHYVNRVNVRCIYLWLPLCCKGLRYIYLFIYLVGRHSSVGIVTRYGLDGPGSIPGGGEIFRSRPNLPWGPPILVYNGYRVFFPGVKWPGRGVDYPPPASARVKERVKLYLYSPSGPSWPVLGRPLPFYSFVSTPY